MEKKRPKYCCGGRILMGLVMVMILGISTFMYLIPYSYHVQQHHGNSNAKEGYNEDTFSEKKLTKSPHITVIDTAPQTQANQEFTKNSQNFTQNKQFLSETPSQTSNDKEVTVVTAYFNLGTFQKGEGASYFGPDLYHKWMKVFRYIENPLVVFVETDEDLNYFQNLRSYLPAEKTKIYKIEREETWAFGLMPKIKDIYSQKGYPKHHPNTVVPEYSCAMHAKYELMHKVSVENPFHTKYLCWLDIGLFRDLTESHISTFHLALPPSFDEDKIAYTEVSIRNRNIPHKEIFLRNYVWVCGCFFIGTHDLMKQWTNEYMNATEKYIRERIMNTDQQILYSMRNEGKLKTQLQTYQGDGRYNPWFHLGYICREEGNKQKLNNM